MWVYNVTGVSLALFYWSLVCTWKWPLNVARDISIESFITVHCEIHQSITFIIVMCTRSIKTKVKQHAPKTYCKPCTCSRGHCLLHLFIIVNQILSIIAYKIHAFQHNIFAKKKVDKKPHNHRNKCSLAGGGSGVYSTHKQSTRGKNQSFPLFICEIAIDFSTQLCCTNSKYRVRIW